MPDPSPGEQPQGAALQTLRPVLAFIRPYRGAVIAAAAALVVAAMTVLAVGQGLRRVIDNGFGADDPAAFNRLLLALSVIIMIMAVATALRHYLISWLGERVTADIRKAVFDHVITLEPGFFETARTGEVMTRLTTDTTLLQTVIGSSASVALRNALLFVGGNVMLIITSPKLTGLVLLGVPLVMAPVIYFGRRVRRLSRATQDRIADVGAYVDESLHAIRTVQAFSHEDIDRRRFGARVEDAFSTAVHRVRMRSLLAGSVIILAFGAVGAVFWVGGHDVMAGRISGGELAAFVFYAVLVAGAVGAISEVVGDLQRAAGAMERLMELLATEPRIKAPAAPAPLPSPVRGEVALTEVVFRYPSQTAASALESVSVHAAPGEKLALVGPSGAGKSTVFQLLLRFYDPDSGTVTLDGVDLRRADPAAVRAHFGLVPQDPVIFGADAWENIRYGRPDADEAQVRAAADAAFASPFLEQLPHGFSTFLGERGVRLSGGQRQRIAIARAILRDPAVLLLDEATSALDAESERLVQEALERLMATRTTLVIAHRLATVLKADRILVMDRGRVVAQGTHGELIRQDGLYARLAALQFSEAQSPCAPRVAGADSQG